MSQKNSRSYYKKTSFFGDTPMNYSDTSVKNGENTFFSRADSHLELITPGGFQNWRLI